MVDFNASFKVNKMSIKQILKKQIKMTFYDPLFKKTFLNT